MGMLLIKVPWRKLTKGRFSTVKRRALGIIRLYILEELQDAMQKQGKYIIVQLLE